MTDVPRRTDPSTAETTRLAEDARRERNWKRRGALDGRAPATARGRDRPYVFRAGGQEQRVGYLPGESDSGLFGGNSNWRGPVWFPVNYLLVEALERYHHFYGDDLRVECPSGSGQMMNLAELAKEISRRLAGIFLLDAGGRRPCHGDDRRFADPAWRDLVGFNEYFDGDTGRGLGAAAQGWTTLALRCIEDAARLREARWDSRRAMP